MLKRFIDIALASAGLIITAPILLVAAALIKLTSPGPVLFRQTRVGLHFKPFKILKLRTMIQAANLGGSLTVDQDPRVTRVGWWLRMAKVDELPQLINVLRGEMSLVGPRPEVSEYVDLFREDYARVLSIRPGVTDLASIRFRDEERVLSASSQPNVTYVTEILPLKIQLAKDYIERSSIGLDLAIVVRTIAYIFLRGGRGSASAARSPLTHGLMRVSAIVAQLLVVVLANVGAFQLRFENNIPDWASAAMVSSLPWLIVIRGLAFIPFRLHQGLWRFFGVYDTLALFGAVASSSVVWLVFTQIAYGPGLYPRSILLIDAFLVTVLLAGLRIIARVYAEFMQLPAPGRRVIIYGAGQAGEQLVREMRQNPTRGYRPIGFLDDDAKKHGQRIHGIPVLGGRADLPRVVHRFRPSEILIAIPSADKSTLEPIVKLGERLDVPVDVLPSLGDARKSRLEVRDLWKAVADRLGRCGAAAQPSFATKQFFRNQTVLVAGAGSVGSELCRQLLRLSPASIVVLDRHEGTLRTLAEERGERSQRVPVIPVLGDINDGALIEALLNRHRPKIVFHAAGFQGSSLVTLGALEVVRTYVSGTRVLAQAAAKHGVDRVVLISEPEISGDVVLNAARRAAEILVTASGTYPTTCCTLMFETAVDFNENVWFRFGEQVARTGLVRWIPTGGPFRGLLPESVALCLNKAVEGEPGASYLIESGRAIAVEEIVTAARVVANVNLGHDTVEDEAASRPRRQDEPVVRRRYITQQPGWLAHVTALERAAATGGRATALAAEALLLATQIDDLTPANEEDVLRLPNGEPAVTGKFARCPDCGGHTTRRVRTRNWRERLKKTLTSRRLFRCDECHWQGWLEPIIVEMPAVAIEPIEVVLSDLDRKEIRDIPLKSGAFKSN